MLGHNVSKLPKRPSASTLETFKNRFLKRNYTITVDCPDFTSLCPVTGQPDFARLQITYVPEKLCVETKSLKIYLGSFRDEPSFNEEIVNRILEDLVSVISPRQIGVIGEFVPRGGISLTIEAQHPNPEVLNRIKI